MKGLLLLVALVGAVGAAIYFFVLDKPSGSSSTRILGVTASFTTTNSIVVDVEVESLTAQPPVGAQVEVTVTCDGASERVAGDIALLNNAQPGDRKTDSVELFARAPFAQQPLKCSVHATTSDGASATACLELGTTRAGGC